jgi:hypothetical protein
MPRKRRLPKHDELSVAASFVRGALHAGRHPAHPDRPPTDRPDVTDSPPPEEPIAAAPAIAAADAEGAAQEQPRSATRAPTDDEASTDDTATAAGGVPSEPGESSAPMDEPRVAAESPVPPSRSTTTTSRGRLRRPLLAAGGACLIVGAAAIVIATAAGGGNSATATTAASDTSTTGLSAPVTLPAIAKGTEPTATPGATRTTLRGGPTNETTSSRNTTEPAGPSTTLGNAATRERMRSLARGAGFTVFALEDPTWQLEQLTLGQTASRGYVAMVYRKGSQYMSVSQEPRARSIEVPNAQKVVIDGQPGELVDMGSVVLLSWRDRGTSITLSTDVPRADALALAAKFGAVN